MNRPHNQGMFSLDRLGLPLICVLALESTGVFAAMVEPRDGTRPYIHSDSRLKASYCREEKLSVLIACLRVPNSKTSIPKQKYVTQCSWSLSNPAGDVVAKSDVSLGRPTPFLGNRAEYRFKSTDPLGKWTLEARMAGPGIAGQAIARWSIQVCSQAATVVSDGAREDRADSQADAISSE